MLCLLQLRQQVGKFILPAGKISDFRILIGGKTTHTLHVAGYRRHGTCLFIQSSPNFLILFQIGLSLLYSVVDCLFEGVGNKISFHIQVQQASQQWKQTQRNRPGQLKSRINISVYNIDQQNRTEQRQQNGNDRHITAEPVKCRKQKVRLCRHQYDRDDQTTEYHSF